MKRLLLMLLMGSAASCFAQSDNNTSDNSTSSNAPSVTAPVSITNQTKEITVDAGAPAMSSDKVYVYCHRRHRSKHALAPEFADLNDPRASKPILVNAVRTARVNSESYKLSVSTSADHMMICPDAPLSIPASIDVERQSEFTGNYPNANKNYKLVSKKTYKKTAKKMRKAEKKEERVARLAHHRVNMPANG